VMLTVLPETVKVAAARSCEASTPKPELAVAATRTAMARWGLVA